MAISRKGDPLLFVKDEDYRADATMDVLDALKPLTKDGKVSAGNSS